MPPLGLPRRKPPPTLAQLGQYEAVQLFIERAQAVRADFEVTTGSAPAVAEICHRLDGLPLAIELAAARIRLFPPDAMLRRLQSRLPLLTGGARDLPLRQQTLQGAIAWSYDLLSPDEQALFRRLSIFGGGATLEAIEAVAAGDELGLDVVEGLERLTEHSLVRPTEDAGEPRFGMLETIREYGLELLETAGEAREAHQRHAAYFLALAEAAEPEMRGAGQGMWQKRLEAEHDNLRAALGWSMVHDPPTALRIAGALRYFWYLEASITEGRTWLDHALSLGTESTSVARAKALEGSGAFAAWQGQSEHGMHAAEAALQIYRSLGNQRGMVDTLMNLGTAVGFLGDRERAVAVTEEALAIARDLGDEQLLVFPLNNLGYIAYLQGNLGRARSLLEEAVTRARHLDGQGDRSAVFHSVGEVRLADGDVEGAESAFREGLAIALESGVRFGIVDFLEGIAVVTLATGHPARAARLFGGAEAQRNDTGVPLDPHLQGEYDRTMASLREALGEEAFIAEWEAGQAFSLDEAVAEALSVTADPTDSTDPAGGTGQRRDQCYPCLMTCPSTSSASPSGGPGGLHP